MTEFQSGSQEELAENSGLYPDKLSYAYDSLKRLSNVTVAKNNATLFKVAQSYVSLGSNRTTTQIEFFNYRSPSGALLAGNKYVYDAAGNIKEIRESESPYRVLSAYTYDSQNQLTQEIRYTYTGTSTTPSSTVTTNYTYDTAGNIRSVSEEGSTTDYEYNNTDRADLLTSYDGHGITYSGGNPTNWYNGETYSSLSWEQGRRLNSLTKGPGSSTTSISYTYDMSGIRSSKTVDGVTHSYITQSGKVVREAYDTITLDFFYDASGKPFALEYTDSDSTNTNTEKYYYVLNAQGDVVGLLDSDGALVARYTYDAWGKLLSVTDTNGNTITDEDDVANVNPLRYRGYFWDSDTGWYYLQSRYYDPIVKRFLNADAYASTGQGFLDHNMFAYCGNNPIRRKDSTGTSWVDTIEEAVEQTIGWIKATATDLWYDATYFHFEGREQLNQPYPSYEEVTAENSLWILLPPEQSIYHDNGVGAPEKKYIHPDGREAVFDGDTHEPVTDPQYMATYNYSVPYYNPEEGLTVKTVTSYFLHFVKDMLPYYLLNNTRKKLPNRYKIQ